MSEKIRELYEDIAQIFVEHGICSTDFAKLTELYTRATKCDCRKMVPLDEVIEFIRAASKDWERLRGDYEKVAACIYIVDELKQKYGGK